MIPDEYRFDLQPRDAIDQAFAYGPLQECPQLGWVREAVAPLDTRFRALLQEDVVVPGGAGEPWWHRHPLRYAGPEAVRDYAAMGIEVAVRGD